MKILHIVPGLREKTNGIAVAARLIAESQGAEVVEAREVSMAQIRAADEVWVHSMWLPMTMKACWKVVRGQSLVVSRQSVVASRQGAGVRLVRMTHANLDPVRLRYHGWKKWLVAPVERWLFSKASRVVVTCEAEREWCEQWGVKGPFEITDLKRFFKGTVDSRQSPVVSRQSPVVRDGRPLHVLYLGRRHPLKGVQNLEQAVREWNEKVRDESSSLRNEFVVVRGVEAPFHKTKDAVTWARETGLIGRMGVEETGGKGVVTISAEGIREALNPRQREKSVSDKIHFSALMKLRELIRASKILETHSDWLKDEVGRRVPEAGENPNIQICVAYAAFEFGGLFYRVRLTLKRYAQTGTSKAYAYRVNEIEVAPGTLGGRNESATYPTGTTSICADILLHGATKVNGEPLLPGDGAQTVELRIVSNHFGEELEKDWEWCDVLCLPTLSENFGLVVAEALERGKRVITTDGAPVWADEPRVVYLRGFREGTDEERVRLLGGALKNLTQRHGGTEVTGVLRRACAGTKA